MRAMHHQYGTGPPLALRLASYCAADGIGHVIEIALCLKMLSGCYLSLSSMRMQLGPFNF